MPSVGRIVDIRTAALAFAAGAVLGHWAPWAQSLWPVWLIGGLALLPVRSLRLLAASALGLGWVTWTIEAALDRRLDTACETNLTGVVRDLPTTERTSDGVVSVRFDFVTASSQDLDCPVPASALNRQERPNLGRKFRLIWIDGPPVRSGEHWRLQVRLRPPASAANTHGFDGGRWTARERVTATGYVLSGERIASAHLGLWPSPGHWLLAHLDRFRERLRERLSSMALVNSGVLAALTLGDAASIPDDDVERYERTSTVHLLVISGLHVGVVTAFGFLLGRLVAFAFGAPARVLAVVFGLVFSGAYVLLAGAGLSVLRAFTMSVVGLVAFATGRAGSPMAAFATALLVVLLIDPMAPLAQGFWLSFTAVAILLAFFAPRVASRRRGSWLLAACTAQLAMTAVFSPVVVAITGSIHPLSFPLNLVLVPLVTFLVVPLALAGTALGPFGDLLLRAADFGVSWSDVILRAADQVPPFHVSTVEPWLFVAGVAALTCLLPTSRLAKAALGSVVALTFARSAMPADPVPAGEVAVDVLDVGQGTAVLVRTRGHALLYDAGPAFRTGGDAGSAVVVPALLGHGVTSLDMVVLSHSDLDHVGGAGAVLKETEALAVLAGEPVPGVLAEPCAAGMTWRWDDVSFRFLWPYVQHTTAGTPSPDARAPSREGNDASCVLLIAAGDRRVLLPGDIGKSVEMTLRLPALDVLVVPHHGSATSSSRMFVNMTRPHVAIVGAGWDNQFGHPHPAVVSRYRAVGSHVVSTAVSGAVRWRSDRPDVVDTERCKPVAWWRQPPNGRWRRPSALSRRLAECVE